MILFLFFSPLINYVVFTCQRPETPPTLILSPNKTSYSAKEILAYSCTKGHQLIGASVSLCDQPDTWNPPTIPNCLGNSWSDLYIFWIVFSFLPSFVWSAVCLVVFLRPSDVMTGLSYYTDIALYNNYKYKTTNRLGNCWIWSHAYLYIL